MDTILVNGGKRLAGDVTVSGAKNASLPILAAALLGDGPSRLGRVPHLNDITAMGAMLEHLGASVRRQNDEVVVDPNGFREEEAPYQLVRKMRASIYVLGPLLARFGKARVSFPGGCAIGDRPIDLHLRGMESLGAEVEVEHGYVTATAKGGRLAGAECVLDGPNGSSVGATCNVLMAAVLARGRSILRGAAREPEVDDLVRFLQTMGARIKGEGTGVLEVEGVERLSGAEYEIIADRIEAGTLLMAGAITGGDVLVRGARRNHLDAVILKLEEMGVDILDDAAGLRVRADDPLEPVAIRTMPYPGFPTDMQAQFMAALAVARGESTITETIFPRRFINAAELNRMGADITLAHATAVVRGVDQLTGASVMCSDLRASAALILAGLAAEGETECLRVYHIDRGYERIEDKLRALGADIRRVSYRQAPPGETPEVI